jgi:hypothetical protein
MMRITLQVRRSLHPVNAGRCVDAPCDCNDSPLLSSPRRTNRGEEEHLVKLTMVRCTGCNRRCYLHGKTHPEVTVQWSLASGRPSQPYCTRACYDLHGEKVSL